ncbi:hypothetical protein [Saccharomonospora xinjiangensis]|uniref:AraC-type arabinose-binding/dimerisation domain-containing protein n=1 Tax=Saccharomonospora xinjiangensis XJ-54 TaxID=882086 RepID=I0V8I9_9PSEU|nr:hypothetical protein [Saccharomonospora xinjiangensis]EID56442.1 hypothetical protein SacxiDRAFT_4261 [Saccharomonospora xinjiangensis XJ-54]
MSRGPHRELLVLDAGESRDYEPDAWAGLLVVVATGELELETVHGQRQRFAHGSVLTLAGLPLRALRASAPTTLITVGLR